MMDICIHFFDKKNIYIRVIFVRKKDNILLKEKAGKNRFTIINSNLSQIK